MYVFEKPFEKVELEKLELRLQRYQMKSLLVGPIGINFNHDTLFNKISHKKLHISSQVAD